MKKIILITITLSCLTATAQAAGIQVSPAKLDFAIINGKPASQTITVVNPTVDVQVFEVYSDDFTDIVKPLPSSFTLESGARKTVEIKIDASVTRQSGGKLGTTLSVVGKPLADNKFSVGTGVKIPLTINFAGVKTKTIGYQWVIIGLLTLIILAMLTPRFRKPKPTAL